MFKKHFCNKMSVIAGVYREDAVAGPNLIAEEISS